MKKILFGALAMLAVVAVSCNKNEGADSAATAPNDSLSEAFGLFGGANMNQQTANLTPEQKVEFMNAFQYIMANVKSEAQVQGAMSAMRLIQGQQNIESEGIVLSRDAMAEGFRKAFTMDSITYSEINQYGSQLTEYYQSARDAAREARLAELEQSPESQQQVRVANEYINRVKSEDPEIQTSSTGLSYKIVEAGDQAVKPSEGSTVRVRYTGRHINGTEFDSSSDEGATFNLRGTVPGFSEGIRLLGKGGKATLYIPGRLAYGPEGNEAGGIAPSEMLVFDVELLDVR